MKMVSVDSMHESFASFSNKICGTLRIEVNVRRSVPEGEYANIFYGHHSSVIDPFIIASALRSDNADLACLWDDVLSRLIIRCTSGCIAVPPVAIGDWRFHECFSMGARACRVLGSIGALANSGKRTNGAVVRETISHLRSGGSIIIFPSGVLGHARWRKGIGIAVHDYLANRLCYKKPLRLTAFSIRSERLIGVFRNSFFGHTSIVDVDFFADYICDMAFGLAELDRISAQTLADVISVHYYSCISPDAEYA